ncbi:hypothetical protein H681_19640 [Pseudomonas sp. ATCC 13867]|nr:hypothetical protein H681_19640 [Pseudomonas sp. ATCC 13867]
MYVDMRYRRSDCIINLFARFWIKLKFQELRKNVRTSGSSIRIGSIDRHMTANVIRVQVDYLSYHLQAPVNILN